MRKFEEIKENIKEINDPVEMAGFLDGIQGAAAIWCRENCPEEVIVKNGKVIEITICGMAHFLNSVQ